MLYSIFCVLKLSNYNSSTKANWTSFPLCPLGFCYHCFRPTSASMFVSHNFALMLSLRVKTAQHCVPPVYTDRAACPPAPATITHPALRSTAPASAERVKNIWSQLDFSFYSFWSVKSHSHMNQKLYMIASFEIWDTQCVKKPGMFSTLEVYQYHVCMVFLWIAK